MDVSSLYNNGAASASVSSRGPDQKLLEDQLSAILVLEESYQVLQIPCTSSSPHSESRPLGGEWRRKICQWSFRVIDHFRLDREVVSFGLNIFDRFLVSTSLLNSSISSSSSSTKGLLLKSKTSSSLCCCECPSCAQSIDSRTYQLAAMTSLYIAIKLHPDNTQADDGLRRKRYFKLESFVELSRGQFEADDICRMEGIILETLKWKVNPPTPMALVAHLLCLMPPLEDIPSASRPTYDLVLHVLQELSRYITELSVCLGSVCTSAPPSQVAYAAILVSMDLMTLKALPMRARDTFHATVSMISLHSGGTLLMPHKQKIRKLSQVLSKSLLPEMLLEEYDSANTTATGSKKKTSDPPASTKASSGSTSSAVTGESSSSSSSSCHPIVIARDYGLLNLSRIHRVCHDKVMAITGNAGAGAASGSGIGGGLESSPTGVIPHDCY